MANDTQKEFERVKLNWNRFYQSERPWINVHAPVLEHAMVMEGIPASRFYSDAKVFINTNYEVGTYYQLDNPGNVADIYNFEIEALGGKMIYSNNAMPTLDHREPLIKGPEDLVKIKTPDFYHDARLPYSLDCIKLSTELGNKGGMLCAPFSMAVGLLGYPAMIKNMRQKPQFAKDLYDLVIDLLILPYVKAQKEYCGVDMVYAADAWACLPNLSFTEMENWVIPYNQKAISKAKELGVTLIGGGGFYNEDRPENFDVNFLLKSFDIQAVNRTGSPSISVFTTYIPDYPYQRIRDYTAKQREHGKKPKVNASFDGRLLREGPVDKIVTVIKSIIDHFAKDYELSIALSNVPTDTPSEHIHAAVAAIHTYGHKPIADNLDKIEFHLPKRESFQEWKRTIG